MSLARLVITAVTVEGRSLSAVARDYGISRVWVLSWCTRYDDERARAARSRPARGGHTRNPRAVGLGR